MNFEPYTLEEKLHRKNFDPNAIGEYDPIGLRDERVWVPEIVEGKRVPFSIKVKKPRKK